MNKAKRIAVYARQNGGATNDNLDGKTVAELRELAKKDGISVPSKARKDQIKDLLQGSRSTVKLTPKQRKRLRLKGNREAA